MSDSGAIASTPLKRCSSCGALSDGNFCSECGKPLTAPRCLQCNSPLAAGARFCNECGVPVGTPGVAASQRASANRTTIAMISVAVVAVLAFVAFQIGMRPRTATAVQDSKMPLATSRGPDISSMSPREQASRLYARIMRLHEEQKADSVAFFANMALGAFAAIPDMDLDARYDMARVAMVAGALPVARAQTDTILQRDSTHLLGLMLAADLARSTNNEVAANRAEATLLAAAPRERARNLPEYQAHAAEIESTLKRLGATKR